MSQLYWRCAGRTVHEIGFINFFVDFLTCTNVFWHKNAGKHGFGLRDFVLQLYSTDTALLTHLNSPRNPAKCLNFCVRSTSYYSSLLNPGMGNVMQRVAVCCSVLQWCCSVLHCVAVCCSDESNTQRLRFWCPFHEP